MGIRVTEDELQSIIDAESGADLQIFIDIASPWVDEVFKSTTLVASQLKSIELYLSAHLATLTLEGARVTMEKTGQSSIQFASFSGEGLKSTRFGEIAIALDTSGKLISSTLEKARFQVLGPKTLLNE